MSNVLFLCQSTCLEYALYIVQKCTTEVMMHMCGKTEDKGNNIHIPSFAHKNVVLKLKKKNEETQKILIC